MNESDTSFPTADHELASPMLHQMAERLVKLEAWVSPSALLASSSSPLVSSSSTTELQDSLGKRVPLSNQVAKLQHRLASLIASRADWSLLMQETEEGKSSGIAQFWTRFEDVALSPEMKRQIILASERSLLVLHQSLPPLDTGFMNVFSQSLNDARTPVNELSQGKEKLRASISELKAAIEERSLQLGALYDEFILLATGYTENTQQASANRIQNQLRS